MVTIFIFDGVTLQTSLSTTLNNNCKDDILCGRTTQNGKSNEVIAL